MPFSVASRFGTRKLHTDSDEMLFSATQPCLLNGIPDLAHRPDLADRAIDVTLPVITAAMHYCYSLRLQNQATG
ncbi:hypothetical protein [Yoonia sediminilitoris]|uniref:Uncharacterized protein n=1 Tax=Yoonia sediminilitoris TaxID=1286148 RepID=A0A2T6KG14_9RHOB|nr:hypothetical protein [Yoonia sediminilitoris]PUB14248.1 hypothetical protein C8N45_106122 [Yoonia sediminilitoris]RCW95179.1 hypothetical protein DFP92_106122 [Yoonia sediminilitoris]